MAEEEEAEGEESQSVGNRANFYASNSHKHQFVSFNPRLFSSLLQDSRMMVMRRMLLLENGTSLLRLCDAGYMSMTPLSSGQG